MMDIGMKIMSVTSFLCCCISNWWQVAICYFLKG